MNIYKVKCVHCVSHAIFRMHVLGMVNVYVIRMAKRCVSVIDTALALNETHKYFHQSIGIDGNCECDPNICYSNQSMVGI